MINRKLIPTTRSRDGGKNKIKKKQIYLGLTRIGALIGIGAPINKNTFEGGRLFERGRVLEGER